MTEHGDVAIVDDLTVRLDGFRIALHHERRKSVSIRHLKKRKKKREKRKKKRKKKKRKKRRRMKKKNSNRWEYRKKEKKELICD